MLRQPFMPPRRCARRLRLRPRNRVRFHLISERRPPHWRPSLLPDCLQGSHLILRPGTPDLFALASLRAAGDRCSDGVTSKPARQTAPSSNQAGCTRPSADQPIASIGLRATAARRQQQSHLASEDGTAPHKMDVLYRSVSPAARVHPKCPASSQTCRSSQGTYVRSIWQRTELTIAPPRFFSESEPYGRLKIRSISDPTKADNTLTSGDRHYCFQARI